MATVTFDHVTKVFGDVVAVNDIDLQIRDGEFMVLVGPSGCGKTTCLRMIAGLEDVTEGTLKIGDRVVNDIAPKDRDIAMVFQSYALYPHMSVYDNLAFGLKLRKVPKADIDRRVKEAAAILHLDNLLDRRPKALSGGQRQRVAVGRAIVREPAVFLMDEPLSNLDAKLRVQTRAELLRIHARLATTTVYVTHDQVEAMTMGQRIAVMSDAVLQQVGTPQELYDAPVNRFVAGFIGSPAMNFLDVTIRGSGAAASIEAPGVSIPVPPRFVNIVGEGADLVLGLRPEHLQLAGDGATSGRIAARADVVEYLGNEELVHTDVSGSDVVAVLPAEAQVRPGDSLSLTARTDRIHLFDRDSTASLLNGRAA
jgi:multiple sugar transport system ATP-binding protein